MLHVTLPTTRAFPTLLLVMIIMFVPLILAILLLVVFSLQPINVTITMRVPTISAIPQQALVITQMLAVASLIISVILVIVTQPYLQARNVSINLFNVSELTTAALSIATSVSLAMEVVVLIKR